MTKIFISVEGQTEETFVTEVLKPYFEPQQLYLIPVLVKTRRMPNAPDFRGGFVPYQKIKKELQSLLGDTSVAAVSTMYDFYALGRDFPGMDTIPNGSGRDRVAHLEQFLLGDIDSRRFRPYLQLHEFESFLFVDVETTANLLLGDNNALQELQNINRQFPTPEEIDDDPNSAPSKRIERIFPEYQKVLDGPLITIEVGLEKLRTTCAHFNAWLTWLESLV